MAETNFTRAVLSSSNSISRADENNKEVHAENSSGGIVLQTQIDVLVDSESKASSAGEVSALELVFLYFQTTIKNFLSLITTNL